ncbi:hypothetical protein ACLB2K_055601 [Fragaria x ananassa]
MNVIYLQPLPSVVKINFDGSVLQQSSVAAVGFVLRDDAGCHVVVAARRIGKTNVSIAEATALKDSLVKNVVVEGDSSLVINCVNM